MRRKIFGFLLIAASLALFLSACSGGAAHPTPDAAVISTAAAQTVEARFTAQAPTATATPIPVTDTPAAQVSDTATPTAETTGAGSGVSNGKACYTMTFLGDVSISDGMILAPGIAFTKTWRVRNDGNCAWDTRYTLMLDKGDNLGAATSYPITKTIYPGDTMDFSIPMTAPTSLGSYNGYYHILTPFGGFMGVGSYNQDLAVSIEVSSKPQKDFGIVSVSYDYNRQPFKGCGSDGAVYNFQATVTANAPGQINYRWDTTPASGGDSSAHTLTFPTAGSKTVYFSWPMPNGKIQNIDRQVWLTTIVGIKETSWSRILFYFTCKTP